MTDLCIARSSTDMRRAKAPFTRPPCPPSPPPPTAPPKAPPVTLKIRGQATARSRYELARITVVLRFESLSPVEAVHTLLDALHLLQLECTCLAYSARSSSHHVPAVDSSSTSDNLPSIVEWWSSHIVIDSRCTGPEEAPPGSTRPVIVHSASATLRVLFRDIAQMAVFVHKRRREPYVELSPPVWELTPQDRDALCARAARAAYGDARAHAAAYAQAASVFEPSPTSTDSEAPPTGPSSMSKCVANTADGASATLHEPRPRVVHLVEIVQQDVMVFKSELGNGNPDRSQLQRDRIIQSQPDMCASVTCDVTFRIE